MLKFTGIVLGGGAFGRQVGLEEVMRVGLPRWDSVFREREGN